MKLKIVVFALATLIMQSVPLPAAYITIGIFTVDGNNFIDNNNSTTINPIRIENLPNASTLRITYISGYFINCGPVPGWGAYAIDPVRIKRSDGSVSSFLWECQGPFGGYYSTSEAAMSCASSQSPLILKNTGNWIELAVIYDYGAICETLTRRSGSLTMLIEVNITNQPISLGISLTNGIPLLQLTAATNFTYLIQSSTNLVDWTPTALLLNTNGTAQFIDSAVTNSNAKFYRAVLP